MDKRLAIFIAYTSGSVALFFFGVAEFLADGDDVAESVVHMTRILGGAAVVATLCAAYEALSTYLDE